MSGQNVMSPDLGQEAGNQHHTRSARQVVHSEASVGVASNNEVSLSFVPCTNRAESVALDFPWAARLRAVPHMGQRHQGTKMLTSVSARLVRYTPRTAVIAVAKGPKNGRGSTPKNPGRDHAGTLPRSSPSQLGQPRPKGGLNRAPARDGSSSDRHLC